MTVTLQSWMLPVLIICIGLILTFSGRWEGEYIQLPGDAIVAGILIMLFGIGMLFGVLLP